jgi:hypothetical protein
MIDNDLADIYGVEVKRLNEQVKRNTERFPTEFCFQLSEEERQNLKSQFATSSWGGRRTNPYAFTEQGVAMLSGVLGLEPLKVLGLSDEKYIVLIDARRDNKVSASKAK